jgi:hypothetical protein
MGRRHFDEALEVTARSVDDSERAALQTLFERAAAGLTLGEREVVELQLRYGLEASEVADVLGVSRDHAHTLLSRARGQLETCLAVLLVSHAGRDECGELGSLLAGWDGRLSVPLRKRVHRHIERCATCAARCAFELRPAMLLGLAPGAALAAGAAAAREPAANAAATHKAQTLALATGRDPVAAAHRAAVLARAGSFGKRGFPTPVRGGRAGLARQHGAGGVTALRRVLSWGRDFLRPARLSLVVPLTSPEPPATVTPSSPPTATPLVSLVPDSSLAITLAARPGNYNCLLITSYP